jgi:hypothetical protein
MELMPHQIRVVIEKKDLDARIDTLRTFLRKDPTYALNTLGLAEVDRMESQLGLMVKYSAVLAERIGTFVAVNSQFHTTPTV